MAEGYIIASTTAANPVAHAACAKATTLAIETFGGQPLARGGKTATRESEGRVRNVVIGFSSFGMARDYCLSPQNQVSVNLCEPGGLATFIIAEGT